MKTALTIVYIVICVILIAVVLFQQGNDAGMSGAVGGVGSSTDTFFGKNRSRTLDGILERWTTVVALLFVALSVVLALI